MGKTMHEHAGEHFVEMKGFHNRQGFGRISVALICLYSQQLAKCVPENQITLLV